MASDKLDQMEFPRLMHGPNGTNRRVENADEAREAQKEGFGLTRELTDEQKKAVADAEKKHKGEKAPAEPVYAKAGASPVQANTGNDFGGKKK